MPAEHRRGVLYRATHGAGSRELGAISEIRLRAMAQWRNGAIAPRQPLQGTLQRMHG